MEECYPTISSALDGNIQIFKSNFFIEHLWWMLLYFEVFFIHMTTYKVYYVIVEYGLLLQEQRQCITIFLGGPPTSLFLSLRPSLRLSVHPSRTIS